MKNNSGFPDHATVERIRESYPPGCRVVLESMDDPYTKLVPGDQGTVMHVDDIGTVAIVWDCGSRLGVVYGVDQVRKVNPQKTGGSEYVQ